MESCANSVLIVDDSSTVRSAIRKFLEVCMQMRVCGEAANGVEAIAIATERKPGLILMDLSMPSMNGIEAASVIKRQTPESRIIVFTLYQDSIGKAMAKAVGVDVVVSKTEGSGGLMAALMPLLTEGSPFC
ncbi:MAG TPA: response regulator transcription factor [Candidatus Acidoferrales bacterium]|nr:response regulator transcription factor [Candidatus Acidoferrales bacterium]